MKIFNTLTKEKEYFIPVSEQEVRMYTCGVTVYDHCHIGHARSLYVFEVIRRYLAYRGYKVTFVRNITDVDDKIINKARAWAKERNIALQEAFDEVRCTYIDSYYHDLERLNIPKADFEPKATENIKEMRDYIAVLIEKGFAYEKEDGVYFSPKKQSGYGRLSGNSLDQMMSSLSEYSKDDALDFALWKKAKDDEPAWDSPWGRGRPGWHIECSVMSQKYLNTQTLDIHGGGLDLVFPHHENERAQSESYSGKPFANYWIHHGLLTIEKQKMAKSLGNFYTIRDVLDKYHPDILKLFYLQAHYSSSIDFSWEKMEEAKKAYERIVIFRDKLTAMDRKEILDQEAEKEFIQAMDDDFNMPKALAVLFEMVSKANALIGSDDRHKDQKLSCALKVLNTVAGIFCFTFEKEELTGISEEQIEEKINLRQEYKKNRDYQKADDLRKDLESQGIILEDTKEGTSWRRKI